MDEVDRALIITQTEKMGHPPIPTARVEGHDLGVVEGGVFSKACSTTRHPDDDGSRVEVVEAAVTANMCRARARIAGRIQHPVPASGHFALLATSARATCHIMRHLRLNCAVQPSDKANIYIEC